MSTPAMTRFKLAVLFVCVLILGVPRPAASQAADPIGRRVEALLRQMSVEEKVGQMTQIALQSVSSRPGTPTVTVQLDSAKLDYAINQRHIGALLNVYNVAMSPEEWRDANNMIARFSARAHLKIPVIYGIDAVHGDAVDVARVHHHRADPRVDRGAEARHEQLTQLALGDPGRRAVLAAQRHRVAEVVLG